MYGCVVLSVLSLFCFFFPPFYMYMYICSCGALCVHVHVCCNRKCVSGCFSCLHRNDWWLPCGIAGFVAGLFSRKISGSTEYQHWIMEVHENINEPQLNSLGCEQPSRPRCRTITQCAGRVSANARPLQLR